MVYIQVYWSDKMKKILIFFLIMSLAVFSRGTFTDLKWGDNPDAVVGVLGKAGEIDGNEMVYNQLKFLDITFSYNFQLSNQKWIIPQLFKMNDKAFNNNMITLNYCFRFSCLIYSRC